MWKLRSRPPTWWTWPWTTSSRAFSCSQGRSGRAARWWAEREPRRPASGHSLALKTHFYALPEHKWINMLFTPHFRVGNSATVTVRCNVPSGISLRPWRLRDRWEYPESSWKIPLSVLERLWTLRLASSFQPIRGCISVFSSGPFPRQVQHGLSFLRTNSLMRRSKHRTTM